MGGKQVHAVTGAFGYSGKYIAARLLAKGMETITLTNSPDRPNPFEGKVKAFPFNFDKPEKLAESLAGVKVLYNTYWVRFNHPGFSQNQAVANAKALFSAARRAGVERVVHISVTNPSITSPLEYFRGKGELDEDLKASGMSYSIIRPAVLFGKEDILINNIAWTLRNFPVFGVFGDGEYKLTPIYVDDLARIAVEEGEGHENRILDAVGPETFTYRELVGAIGRIIGKERPVVSVPVWFGRIASSLIGYMVNDVLVTPEEIEGLMAGLLYTGSEPLGTTTLTGWAGENAATLGVRYANELSRRTRRDIAYEKA
jgi:NADH dehydrogenase